MRIALAQIVSGPDPAANLALVAEQTRAAAVAGADLVVFPEATMCCFGEDLVAVAEPLEGPWAGRVRALAAAAGTVVAVGMFTPAAGGRVRNTLLVSGPGVEASYDKIHVFDAFGYAESDTVEAGDKPLVVQVGGVGVGFTLCYDLRFPGLYTALADAGAAVICVAASWGAGPGKVGQWELLTRARAADTTTFLLGCDQGDPATLGRPAAGPAPTGVGHSVVVGPSGEVLDALGAEPGLLVRDVDPATLAAVRESVPVLANRRF